MYFNINALFSNVCLGFMCVSLLFGIVVTYAVRNVPSDFNESRWIAFSIYNWFVIGVALVLEFNYLIYFIRLTDFFY